MSSRFVAAAIGLVYVAVGLACARLPAAQGTDENGAAEIEAAVTLLNLVIDADADAARQCLVVISNKVQNREIAPEQVRTARTSLEPTLAKILDEGESNALYPDAAILAASVRLPRGTLLARGLWQKAAGSTDLRLRALATLVFLGDETLFDNLKDLLDVANPKARDLRAGVLANLGRSESPRVAALVLEIYDSLDADLRSKAIELLTQRPLWSKALLHAIGRQQIPSTALHANQVAKLMAGRDDELRKLVVEKWGSVRTERNPQREQVIADVRKMLQTVSGNPVQGQVVFQRVCGQCHKIYGQGQDVGPDISANGRASFDQLLSNVLDPSLTIGASYQARTVVTVDGRVLNGLLAEDNDQRVVLKMQGGKIETIPREDIDELNVSQLSLMPEGLETQLKPEELADLFAFLALDKPPADPAVRYLPGTPRP